MKGKINLLLVLSLIVFFIYSLKKKSRIIWILFFSIFIKSVAVLLFSAQYRFFTDVFFVIFLVIFYEQFSKKRALILFANLSLFSALFLSFPSLIIQYLPSFKLGNYMTGFNKNQF
jgi:hypothetical protein